MVTVRRTPPLRTANCQLNDRSEAELALARRTRSLLAVVLLPRLICRPRRVLPNPKQTDAPRRPASMTVLVTTKTLASIARNLGLPNPIQTCRRKSATGTSGTTGDVPSGFVAR